jgi:hypothetical protein
MDGMIVIKKLQKMGERGQIIIHKLREDYYVVVLGTTFLTFVVLLSVTITVVIATTTTSGFVWSVWSGGLFSSLPSFSLALCVFPAEGLVDWFV